MTFVSLRQINENLRFSFIMKIKQINSLRNCVFHPSYSLVFEWEDEISRAIGLPVHQISKYNYLFDYLLNKRDIYGISFGIRKHLFFELFALENTPRKHSGNRVPIIIDYFLEEEKTKAFIKNSRKSKLILITSREVYEYLLNEGADPKKFKHLALSLPDIYKLNEKEEIKKEYDVILVGRTSPVFKSFLSEYQKQHPELSVLSQKVEDGQYNLYDSEGKLVGNANTRASYLEWLRKSRIFMYCTSGYDGERKTNGFSQVTPKFLEALACGCHVIIRYPDNPDTRFYELSRFGESTETYEQFEKQMDMALATTPDLEFYSDYLKKHYTSQRAKELKNILDNV